MPDLDALTDWFARRTFTVGDLDLPTLVGSKRSRNLTISVILPARNEADTISGVVEAAMSLSGQLVDEVVVVDAASTDGTPELAAAAGAKVVQDADILTEFGPVLGKGDALWRALAVTSGDLVAYVDTDIRNPHPQLVWGILAPLLLDDQIDFVKSFYDRPLEVGGVLAPSGGGRVTELMARPLLNLFWPELAGLVQPLSGEYAGRRSVLERVGFFTGYGVELALLIDILGQRGADAIAQIDIGRRVHRNQALPELSRMAFAVAQVALQRLTQAQRAQLRDPLERRYLQFERGPSGQMVLHAREVGDVERPPLHDLV